MEGGGIRVLEGSYSGGGCVGLYMFGEMYGVGLGCSSRGGGWRDGLFRVDRFFLCWFVCLGKLSVGFLLVVEEDLVLGMGFVVNNSKWWW